MSEVRLCQPNNGKFEHGGGSPRKREVAARVTVQLKSLICPTPDLRCRPMPNGMASAARSCWRIAAASSYHGAIRPAVTATKEHTLRHPMLPQDTRSYPNTISRTGVKSRSDRVSARSLGRPPWEDTGKVPNRMCDR